MRIINLFFILVFLLSAFLQLNDPDPLLWFSLYFSGVVLCAFAVFRKIDKKVLWLFLGIYTIYACYLLLTPDGVLSWIKDHHSENITQTMKAQKPWIENTREFFGLLILCSAAILNLVFFKKRKENV